MSDKFLPFFVRLGLIAMGLCLPACVTYQAHTANPATVHGSHSHQSVYYWDAFEISKIDGQSVGAPLTKTAIRVDPGPRLLEVFHRGQRGFGGHLVASGYVALAATLKPGREYEVTGNATGGNVRVWLQEVQTGEKASNVAERPLIDVQDRGPEYIPIFVKVR